MNGALVMTIDEKFESLRDDVRSMESVVVAYSAGVDSTFLLNVAVDVLGPANVLAATGVSDSLAEEELEQAKTLAIRAGTKHVLVHTEEFDNPDYLANPVNRCYFCKDTLYKHLVPLASEHGMKTVVSGTNADDLGDYRPGLSAASEHEVRTPLARAGLTKADVRTLSRRMGLPTHDKPASPCLSSRIPYGQPVTPQKLRMIEQAEKYLHELGIRECRVRHHDDVARIEVPPEHQARLMQTEVAASIVERFKSLGYKYVTLDLVGFRSGSLNEVLPPQGTTVQLTSPWPK